MFICRFCSREFEKKCSLTSHEKYYCQDNPERIIITPTSVYTIHHKSKCKYCNKEIDVAGIKRHEKACGDPNSKLNTKKESTHVTHDGLNCIYCNKECKNKNSLAQHEIRCVKNPDRKDYDKLIGYGGSIKGQTLETSELVRKLKDGHLKALAEGRITFPDRSHMTYIYSEHNQLEIQKWKDYINSREYIFPDYQLINPVEGYNVIAKQYIKVNNTIKITFEHDFLANILLDDNLSADNVVHHINQVRDDNDINNLLIFATKKDHKRFHASTRAYLIYDDTTHLFTCTLMDKEE